MAIRSLHGIRSRLTSGSWWVSSLDGRTVLGQLPNPALCVWIAAMVLGWADLPADHAATVEGIGNGALLVWALDEAVRGASPFRHLLGVVVLSAHLSSLFLG
jgi:hypothetical protein